MISLGINRTKDTPAVTFDIESNSFSIKGRSLPENALEFYKPIYDWIVEYSEKNKDKGIWLNLDLEYMNSSSIKLIFHIINKIDAYYSETNAKNETGINWGYRKNDELTKLKGQEYQTYFTIPIKLVIID